MMNVGRSSRWGGALSLLLLALLANEAEAQVACMSTFNEIVLRESLITDTSFSRLYVLCPMKQFSVGDLNFDKETISGQRMMPLRTNIEIRCGESGSRENGCFVDGGVVQVDGTNLYDSGPEPMENVIVKGITFTKPLQYAARFNRPGNVVFDDCEFRDMDTATVPVLLDYFDARNPSSTLEVTFRNCLFDNIMYGGKPRQPSLIVSRSRQNRIVIESTRFTNNDMVTNNLESAKKSYLIEASGPLTITGSCFENNKVGVSPVASYNPEFSFVENYQFMSTGSVCTFASHFETPESFELFMPRCTRFDLTGLGAICPLDGTKAPTSSPTAAPTGTAPTVPPTASPTGLPTTSPTAAPAGPPTAKPTTGPTEEGANRGIGSSGERVKGYLMATLLGMGLLLL